jgi:beta-N-acetylhexosaminidase
VSFTQAAVVALNAGCDMVLLCNQSQVGAGCEVDALLDGLATAAQRREWQPSQDSERRRLALLPQSAPLGWDDLMHHSLYQHALEKLV